MLFLINHLTTVDRMWPSMLFLYAITALLTALDIGLANVETPVLKSIHSVEKRANFSVKGVEIAVPKEATKDVGKPGEYLYPCYVSVVVYKTPDDAKQNNNQTVENATVTVITKERNVDIFLSYSQASTDRTGHACVLSLCRKEAIIFVQKGEERLYATETQSEIPRGYTYTYQSRSEEIRFSVRSWGTIAGKTGPVYNLGDEDNCLRAGKANMHFDFSYISVPENLRATPIPMQSPYQDMAWEYVLPGDPTYQICYIKVKVQVPSYQARIDLVSRRDDGRMYGTYTAGPKTSPNSPKQNVKAACLQYRCPIQDIRGKDQDTSLQGTLSIPSRTDGCKFTIADGLKGSLTANFTTFELKVKVNNNYGPTFGIYKDRTRAEALKHCYTGSNIAPADYKMNPETEYAIAYDCSARSPLLVG